MRRFLVVLAAVALLGINAVPAPTNGDGGGGGGGGCSNVWVHDYGAEPNPADGTSFLRIVAESETCNTVTFRVEAGNHLHYVDPSNGLIGTADHVNAYVYYPTRMATGTQVTFTGSANGNLPWSYYQTVEDFGEVSPGQGAVWIGIASFGPSGSPELPYNIGHLTFTKPSGNFCFRLKTIGSYTEPDGTQPGDYRTFPYQSLDSDDVGSGSIPDESVCSTPF